MNPRVELRSGHSGPSDRSAEGRTDLSWNDRNSCTGVSSAQRRDPAGFAVDVGAKGARRALGILFALILVPLRAFDVDTQERWQLLVRDWVAAVNAHVPGEADEAARSIAAWTRAELELALPFVGALTNLEADLGAKGVNASQSAYLRELATIARGHGEAHRLALRGALLHTDIVTIVVVYGVATSPARSPFLNDLTSLTGGQTFEIERESDLTLVFQRVLDEFRYRYLVTYTPRGVTNSGYDRLSVRVRHSGATVRARPGYQADR